MFSDSMMLGGGRQAAFSIPHSVRLDGVADYFSRTFIDPTTQGRWTISLWFKRSQISQPDRRQLIGGNSLNDGTRFAVFIDANDSLRMDWDGQANQIVSLRKFRDTTAWYHLVISFDGTAASNQNRLRIWINGGLETEFSSFNASVPSTVSFNKSTQHFLGSEVASGHFSGYFAEICFIDGSVLSPSDFGETDPVTGSWQPKLIGGLNFGINGFHLNFADPANLGQDVSGNANHWTPVSLGSADVVADSPTNNFAVFNPLRVASGATYAYANGNRTATVTSNGGVRVPVTLVPTSGKYRVRFFYDSPASTANCGIGFGASIVLSDGSSQNLGGFAGAAWSVNDFFDVDVDVTAGTIEISRNGAAYLSARSFTFGNDSAGDSYYALLQNGGKITINAGQDGTSYSASGTYKPLCTANLPKPAIQSPAKHFDVVTYTGTGAAQSITGLSFQPDLVWCKRRSGSGQHHCLVDSVRGAANYLSSNSTGEENWDGGTSGLTFTADGFDVSATSRHSNDTSHTYVAWCWKAGGAAVSNTDGTIPSMVSVNQAAGFSIVSYTGTATNATVGHGLEVAPKLAIIKGCTNLGGSTMQWDVWHTGLATDEYLVLNSTDGKASAPNVWNGTIPNASTINVGDAAAVNAIGDQYIAYCWAEIPGFSKFGSYTGNGSADGPFVHCGFRPRWVMVKVADAVNDWTLLDSGRSPENPVDEVVYANLSNPEVVNGSHKIDFLANGFKIRSTDSYATINGSGYTYIFAAFAEAPFGGKKTTPAKAR